jgi:hypothetical protein
VGVIPARAQSRYTASSSDKGGVVERRIALSAVEVYSVSTDLSTPDFTLLQSKSKGVLFMYITVEEQEQP